MTKPNTVVRTKFSVRYCGACNGRIGLEDKFCRHCGEKIDWGEYLSYARERKERREKDA